MTNDLLPDDHEEIYLEPKCAYSPFDGRTWAHDHPWECQCGKNCPPAKYIRADLVSTHNKPAEVDWIKAQPHETYDGLKKQFMALKNMLNSMGEQLSFYSKKDYSLSEKRLAALEESLESERAMNAKLTEENGHLATGKGGV